MRKFNEAKFKHNIIQRDTQAILEMAESCSRQELEYIQAYQAAGKTLACLTMSEEEMASQKEGKALCWRRYLLFKSMRLGCEEELERRFTLEAVQDAT